MNWIKSKCTSEYVDILSTIVILFLLFSLNFFHTVGSEYFNNFQQDSEALVIQRLYYDGQLGFFSFGRFLGNVYMSQIGLQGIFFSLLNLILPFSAEFNQIIFRLLSSLILAMVITYVLIFLKKEFGRFVLPVSIIGIMIGMPFLVSMGRNLYWVPFTFFLPMICILFFYQHKEKFFRGDSFSFTAKGIIFVVVFIKCACGYEFISTVLLAGCVPMIYYTVLRQTLWKVFFRQVRAYTCVSIAAFFTSMCVHLLQCYLFLGSWEKSFHALMYIIAKRTTDFGVVVDPFYTPSLKTSVFKVVWGYLKDPLIIILFLIILFVIVQFVLHAEKRKRAFSDRKFLAGGIACCIAFLAPLSWFILAKGHSFVHKNINFVLWDVPFTLFFIAFVVYVLREYIITKASRKVVWILLGFIVFSLWILEANKFHLSAEDKKNFLVFGYKMEREYIFPKPHVHKIKQKDVLKMQRNIQANETAIEITPRSLNLAKLEIADHEILIDGTEYSFDIEHPVGDKFVRVLCKGLTPEKIEKDIEITHKKH